MIEVRVLLTSMSGVQPPPVTASTRAPLVTTSLRIWVWPSRAAKWAGLQSWQQ